jgi:signal transduction histidine kinase
MIIHIVQSINQDNILIEISDTGVGIKKENLSSIMESFYKIDPKSLGAGLGLSISKGIVDLHGGTLEIDSEYGKGTTVSISLPIKFNGVRVWGKQ